MLMYPDISNNNPGYTVTDQYPIVCLKASEGTTFRDPLFPRFLAEARAAGVFPFAYHWLHSSPVAAQVANCCAVVPPGMPVMIDWEDTSDVATTSQAMNFALSMRAAGRPCNLLYLPEWFWNDHLGHPDLSAFGQQGMRLVSSNYTGNPNAPAGWVPYGAMTPAAYQFTDNYQGTGIDMNAYNGTVEQFVAMLTGNPAPTPPPAPQEVKEMKRIVLKDSTGQLWISDLMSMRQTTDKDAANAVYLDPAGFITQKDLPWEDATVWTTLDFNKGLGSVVRISPDLGAYGTPVGHDGAAGTLTITGTVGGTLNVS